MKNIFGWFKSLSGANGKQGAQSSVQNMEIASPTSSSSTESETYKDQGNAFFGSGKLDEAASCYRKAIAISPAYVDAHNNLGLVLQAQGYVEEAEQCLRHALELNPSHANAAYNLALLLDGRGDLAGAKKILRSGLQGNPDYENFHLLLAEILLVENDLAGAADSFRQALRLVSNHPRALSALAMISFRLGKYELAISQYENLLVLQPQDAEAHNNLGVAFQYRFEYEKSLASCRRAIAIAPDYADAHFNAGNALTSLGKVEEALLAYDRAVQLSPELFASNTALLFTQNYHPTRSAAEIFSAYQRWNGQYAAHLASAKPLFSNEPDRRRRLRVGYVSADFNQHAVACFALPLLEAHDSEQVEVFCYYNNHRQDQVTERFKTLAKHWRPCAQLNDEQLADCIRADRIDVLVDLSGHTAGNRLLVFARKPAPVQVSWMGFGYTTGLSAMNYFIGDQAFTPPGVEDLFSETVYRLPHAFVSYQPPPVAPLPGVSPAAERGYVTFACLSRAERINSRVIAAWAAILQRLPQAHLRLDSRSFSSSHLCQEVRDKFTAYGVALERLELGMTTPVWEVYRQVDVVLDCFPHNSGTTTCEALWMGIPVITLAERPSVGRIGAAYLTAVGKTEWIADDVDGYIELAVQVGSDLPALVRHRSELRQQMSASPLLDHSGFARDMEIAYRDMWCRWCDSAEVVATKV